LDFERIHGDPLLGYNGSQEVSNCNTEDTLEGIQVDVLLPALQDYNAKVFQVLLPFLRASSENVEIS
jgi:hypothetical protein